MENKKIILPEAVDFILRRLNERGYRADVVGGPVRDFLLGKIPEDYDITTNALPEETKAAFSDVRVIETGIKHGTLTLLVDGGCYEVTTYRIDGEYKDARHPESVEFTRDINEDLARRDFTMNAISYNHKDGITDPFGGEDDIKRSTIRAVGDPCKRFSEDALRILRGIRFSSTLGFVIEKATREGIFAKKHLLSKVSRERIYTEWRKLLSGDGALSVFDGYREVIGEFLPEIKDSPLPDKERFLCADYMSRLLSLFYLGKKSGEEFFSAMKRLKTDSDCAEDGRAVLSAVGRFGRASFGEIGRLLCSLGEERTLMTARLEILLGNYGNTLLEKIEKYLGSGGVYKISQLAVGGDDLKAAGLWGRQIGEALQVALFKVIDGEWVNDKCAILEGLGVTKNKLSE